MKQKNKEVCDIIDAINKVYDVEFQKALKKVINPYWQGGATEKIIDKLKTIDLSNIIKKHGVDWISKVKLGISSLYDLTPAQEDKIVI